MQVFLTGHGGHTPNNGFFALPKNCTMTFYKDDALYVPRTMNALKQNPDRALCRVVCTNFVGVDQANLAPIVRAISNRMPNEKLDFVWACCRDLSLRHVPGSIITRDAGLNAAERLSDHKFINFDKDAWGFSGTYY